MAITIQNLIDKHSIASKALEEYSSSMADKLATGNFNNSIIHKFNVMSSWMTFLKEKLTPVAAIQGVSPIFILPGAPLVTNQTTFGQKLTIGIENNSGRYVTIFATCYYGGIAGSPQDLFFTLSSLATPDYIDDLGINRGKFSIRRKQSSGSNSLEYEIIFPKTSDFNGQSVVYSPNVVSFVYNPHLYSAADIDNYSTKVNKGVNEVNSGTLITNESKNSYNEILEKIAIELKISY